MAAVPMASAPLEQAEEVQKVGPLAPSTIDVWAEAALAIIIGTIRALTRLDPRACRVS